MIPVVCINDKDKPKEVHADEWIEKGEVYHIVHVYFHPAQSVQGVELKEVKLTERSYPYTSFNLKRFAIPINQVHEFGMLVKQCSELNDVDISELIEHLETEQQELIV
jgi:hypothetical protein